MVRDYFYEGQEMQSTELTGLNPHTLLSLDDVAARFGLARSSVYRLQAQGELPRMFKIGKQNFIRQGTLERFIADREQRALAA
ncbi:helix-turn-helix domain-containing protein [Neorhizobium sp. NCHU2750]|uniref:helix-turn-helix transcriptional regulator n=1 Tax=Neorhizobium sp. NCHU2750 TaxID=1825976 RepID=UPI0013C45398